jgi:hypothetical protein
MVEMVILIQMDQTLEVVAVEQVVQEELLLPQVELVEVVVFLVQQYLFVETQLIQ